jgi:uncharacterized protein (DUF1810 family)
MSIDRFLSAQEGSYHSALAELKAGRKSGCWIWWIFPQERGLGWSDNSVYYGLADEAEASEYLRHPILGSRYRECVEVAHSQLCHAGIEPLVLMDGEVDVMKLRSSLELFRKIATPGDAVFLSRSAEILSRLDLTDSA